jgi:hypothetical protein
MLDLSIHEVWFFIDGCKKKNREVLRLKYFVGSLGKNQKLALVHRLQK